MLIWILILVSVIIFIPFFCYLGKEWYGPYSLFYLPFLACYVIAAYNADKWGFDLEFKTFFILLIGEFAFLIGCVFAQKIKVGRKKTNVNSVFFCVEGDSIKITTSRLALVVAAEGCFFLAYLYEVYMWGLRNGCTVTEAINRIMLNGKFGGSAEPFDLSFILQIFLQMNYIIGYLFAYLLARRILLKDSSNIVLIMIGFIISIMTNFLGGSRGPILEILASLLISFGIVYYYKTSRRIFPKRQLLAVTFFVVIAAIGFFEILPLMGRAQTAKDESDVFTQYIGSQIYNLNYFVEEVDTHSTFFCAETLKSLYGDIESFAGLSLGYRDGMVGNPFVFTADGHDLGNVYTTYYNFYIDFGICGVFIFTFFIGWFSQTYFKSIKFSKSLVNLKLVIYIYMASSIMFSFFASRFFQNVINLKVFIKIFWIIFVYLYITENAHMTFKIGTRQKVVLNKRDIIKNRQNTKI